MLNLKELKYVMSFIIILLPLTSFNIYTGERWQPTQKLKAVTAKPRQLISG
jgi:hypothetical protein